MFGSVILCQLFGRDYGTFVSTTGVQYGVVGNSLMGCISAIH